MMTNTPPLFRKQYDYRSGVLVNTVVGKNLGYEATFKKYKNGNTRALLELDVDVVNLEIDYEVSEFCPKYSPSDRVYICCGLRTGKHAVVIREVDETNVLLAIKNQTEVSDGRKKTLNPIEVLNYSVTQISPLRLSTDPRHSLTAWCTRTGAVDPFFLEGELVVTTEMDMTRHKMIEEVGIFRRYIDFTQQGCPGLFCTMEQNLTSRMIAFEKLYHQYAFGDGVTVNQKGKERMGIVFCEAEQPFYWNVWMVLNAIMVKHHTSVLSRSNRRRGLPMGQGNIMYD